MVKDGYFWGLLMVFPPLMIVGNIFAGIIII